MLKLEITGVNMLDIRNQLENTLKQFKQYVNLDVVTLDEQSGTAEPTAAAVVAPTAVNVAAMVPQTAPGVPTTAVTAQPATITATTPVSTVQVTPNQIAVAAPAINVTAPAAMQPPVATTAAPAAAPVAQDVKKYTLPEIQAALAPLLDAGKTVELQQLMTQFGVQYLGEVPEDRYPELVNAIRGLGARI